MRKCLGDGLKTEAGPLGRKPATGWCGRGLREDRFRRLLECGVHWEGQKERLLAQEQTWQRMLGALRTFQRTFGHLDVRAAGTSNRACRGGWRLNGCFAGAASSTRTASAGSMNSGSNGLNCGTVPAPVRPQPPGGRSGAWDRMFVALQEYAGRTETAMVPSRWPAHRRLATWVANQRALQKARQSYSGTTASPVEQGFEWGGRREAPIHHGPVWDRMYDVLSEHHRIHGRCDVPSSPGKVRLVLWIRRQRSQHRAGRLRDDRVLRFGETGFSWGSPIRSSGGGFPRGSGCLRNSSPINASTVIAMSPRKRVHGLGAVGHASASVEAERVPWPGSGTPSRPGWVGVVDPRSSMGEEISGAAAFHRTWGHCQVPAHGAKGRNLASWVAAQRTRRTSGALDPAPSSEAGGLGIRVEGHFPETTLTLPSKARLNPVR